MFEQVPGVGVGFPGVLYVLILHCSRHLAESSPYMEAMKKKDVEVLFCYEPYDELVLMNLAQFDKKNFKSIESELVDDKSDTDTVSKGKWKRAGCFDGMKRGCNFEQNLTYIFYHIKICVKLGLKNPFLCMCTKFPFQLKAVWHKSRRTIFLGWLQVTLGNRIQKAKVKRREFYVLRKFIWKQECIPVGCVPSAAVVVSPGGVCLSACWDTNPPGADPPRTRHPPCGQTHTCKNITFATSLRTVIRPLNVIKLIYSVCFLEWGLSVIPYL